MYIFKIKLYEFNMLGRKRGRGAACPAAREFPVEKPGNICYDVIKDSATGAHVPVGSRAGRVHAMSKRLPRGPVLVRRPRVGFVYAKPTA